jgi:hypothetical protein
MADVTPGWRHIGTVVAGEAVSLGGLNPLNPTRCRWRDPSIRHRG